MNNTDASGAPLSAVQSLAAGAATALLAWGALSLNLSHVPGLHSDEAWSGLFAMRMQHNSLLSLHAMNWYTSSIYEWVLARVFDVFGAGVFQLRAAGAALNALAAGGMAAFAGALFGLEAVLAVAGLLLLLPFFPLESRLAWEACAFQNALTLAFIAALWAVRRRQRLGLGSALAMCFAAALGTLNHVIFLALPLAAAFGLFLWQTANDDARFSKPLFASLAVLAQLAVLVLCKKGLSQELWVAHRTAALLFFALLPLASAFAIWLWQDSGSRLCVNLSQRSAGHKHVKKALLYLAGAGLAATLWFHGTAFLGLLSGFNVLKRIFSLDLGLAGACVLFPFAAVLCGAVLEGAWKTCKDSQDETARIFAGLMLLSYCAVFTALRNTNSLRYYVAFFFLFVFAASAFLPAFLRRSASPLRLFMAACAVAVSLITYIETALPQPRPPFHYTQGWHDENSAHMIDTSALAAALSRKGVCVFEGDPFLVRPLEFYYAARKWPCRPGLRFSGEYCQNCQEPPYIK